MLQKKKESTDLLLYEINQEKEKPHKLQTHVEEKERFLVEHKKMEELPELKIREDQLTNVMNSIGTLRDKLKQLNQRTYEEFRKNMDRLEQKYGDILHFNKILEHKCYELNEQKNKIIGYYDLIQKEEKPVLIMKHDKAVQTVFVEKEKLQEHDVKKQGLKKLKEFESEKEKLKEDTCDLERKDEHMKTEREDLSMAERDDLTDEKMSKRDFLRKIWKDTKTERKEIDQMKHRGHEMRNNLEKRLKVINQFVKRTWIKRETESLEKTKLEQGLTGTSQSDWERDCKTLDEKHTELQQLKVQMLSEIGKLQVKDKVSRTLKTSDKANQTFQMEVEETETAPHTSSGFLRQLRQCCYRCCCPPCACCGQPCPEER